MLSAGIESEQETELSREILIRPTYSRAVEVTRRLADESDSLKDTDEFERLYRGELVFLETNDVATRMVRFRRTLRGDPNYSQFDLKDIAKGLKAACENALSLSK